MDNELMTKIKDSTMVKKSLFKNVTGKNCHIPHVQNVRSVLNTIC